MFGLIVFYFIFGVFDFPCRWWWWFFVWLPGYDDKVWIYHGVAFIADMMSHDMISWHPLSLMDLLLDFCFLNVCVFGFLILCKKKFFGLRLLVTFECTFWCFSILSFKLYLHPLPRKETNSVLYLFILLMGVCDVLYRNIWEYGRNIYWWLWCMCGYSNQPEDLCKYISRWDVLWFQGNLLVPSLKNFFCIRG